MITDVISLEIACPGLINCLSVLIASTNHLPAQDSSLLNMDYDKKSGQSPGLLACLLFCHILQLAFP